MYKSKWNSEVSDQEEGTVYNETTKKKEQREPCRWTNRARRDKDFHRRKDLDRINASDVERADFWRPISVLQMETQQVWDPSRIEVTLDEDMRNNYPHYDRTVTLKPGFVEDTKINKRKVPEFKLPYEKCSLQESMRLKKTGDYEGQYEAYQLGQGFAYFWQCNRQHQFGIFKTYRENVLYWAENNKDEAKRLYDDLGKAMWRWEKEAIAARKAEELLTEQQLVTKLRKEKTPLNTAPYSLKKIQIPASPTSTINPVIDHPITKRGALNLPPHSFLPIDPLIPPSTKPENSKSAPKAIPPQYTCKPSKTTQIREVPASQSRKPPPTQLRKAPPAPRISATTIKPIQPVNLEASIPLPANDDLMKSVEAPETMHSILTPSPDVPPAVPQINLPDLDQDPELQIIEAELGEHNKKKPPVDQTLMVECFGHPFKQEPMSPQENTTGGLANLEKFLSKDQKARRARLGLDPDDPKRWSKRVTNLVSDTKAKKKAAAMTRRSIAAKTKMTLNELQPPVPFETYPETLMETDDFPERILVLPTMTYESLVQKYPNMKVDMAENGLVLDFPSIYQGGEQRAQPSKEPGHFYFEGKLVQSGLWDPSKKLYMDNLLDPK